MQDCLDIVDMAAKLCKELSVDACFFLGDAFHSRVKLDIDVIAGAYASFRHLAQIVPLFILPGNHDQHTKVGDVQSVDIFKDFSRVISVPEILIVNGATIALYPHTSDVEGMKHWLKAMPSVDLFCFHQGLSEAAVGPYDMHVKTELSIHDIPFEKMRYAIAGDFHKRQFLRGGKFHYCGSPLQLSFGERDEEKCFTLIDNWEVKSIPTNAPRFFEIGSLQELETLKANPEKDFIKLTSKSPSELEAAKHKYPRIQIVLEEESQSVIQRADNRVLSDDKNLLEWYIKQSGTSLDPVELLLEGLELLQGAQ